MGLPSALFVNEIADIFIHRPERSRTEPSDLHDASQGNECEAAISGGVSVLGDEVELVDDGRWHHKFDSWHSSSEDLDCIMHPVPRYR